ncbi:hypothetical protein [Streptomyces sp. NPDC007991]
MRGQVRAEQGDEEAASMTSFMSSCTSRGRASGDAPTMAATC